MMGHTYIFNFFINTVLGKMEKQVLPARLFEHNQGHWHLYEISLYVLPIPLSST